MHYMKNVTSPNPHQYVNLDDTWIIFRCPYKHTWEDNNILSVNKGHGIFGIWVNDFSLYTLELGMFLLQMSTKENERLLNFQNSGVL